MKKTYLILTTSFLLSFPGMAQPATGLDFDGVDDYVSCGNILAPSYTKEAWINLSGLAFFNNIISSGGSSQHAFWAPASYGSRLSAGHNLTWNYVQDPTPLVAGTWYHVAVTYDAATTTMNLYKNGILVSTNNAVPPYINGNDISIGDYGNFGVVLFGLIDEVRLWDRALCQDEILNNINCGLNPAGQTGLVALFHFDQGIVNANNAGITTLIDASPNGNNGTLNNFALTGATSNWTTGTVSGTCSPFVPTILAGTPGGGTISSTGIVNPFVTHYVNNCELIGSILPSGGTPVSGSITSKVTIDATVQSYGGSPYVQRHFDIEPATNPAGSTGTIILYYKQVEFNDYNTARGIPPFLPVSAGDATGIANLRISQYHGTGTAPGNYTGLPELIDPADANIVWNTGLSRWEVTFDVNGFSGFFAHSSIGGVLPVNLISFSGISKGPYNEIQWVTAGEQNSDYFDLERSSDGIFFSKTVTILAQTNSSSNKYYSYNDLRGSNSIYYYRLKMIDRNGAFIYSPVIRISSKQNSIISIYPNPAKETINVSVSDTKLLKTDIRLTDLNGRLVSIINLSNLQQPIDIARLNPGIYIIRFMDGSFTKFVKQ